MNKNGKSGTKSRARDPGGPVVSHLPKKLLELLNADDLAGAVKVWREGLHANRFSWSKDAQDFVDTGVPDWDVREKMAAQIAAYMEGKPIERQITATGSFEDLNQILSRIYASPDAMRELADIMPNAPPLDKNHNAA